MAHGIARLSPNYCCDHMRFRCAQSMYGSQAYLACVHALLVGTATACPPSHQPARLTSPPVQERGHG